MNNLLDRYNRLTPEQQQLFGRLICAHAMQTSMMAGSLPFMQSQANVAEDIAVACLDGASLYVPLDRSKEVIAIWPEPQGVA